ncbi:MAG: hypothetical protein ABR535_09450, partial [Pyrinomonadaceae bacterium]
IADAPQRADMVEFLRGLDTGNSSQERLNAEMNRQIDNRQRSSGFQLWIGIVFVFAVAIVGLKIKKVRSSSTP